MFKKQQIAHLKKLQQQQIELDRQLSLQQTQANLIKDYVMKQGTYKVIITIYQLNDLQPKSLKILSLQLDQKTACDAFVQVKVNNQTKKTQIKKQNNNPIFDQQFYFQFPKMSIEQLDRSKIQFSVYDTKFWGKTQSLIGSFQLDWTNVYFKRNHQIYRAWLTLYDPNGQLEGPVGYLLANIAILGENDQITVHDSAFIKDPLVTIQDTITSPKTPLKDFSISIQIYRAENLIPIDFNTQIKAYVIAKFSGNKIKTSSVKSLNPQWNQCIKIGTQVPNKSKYIILQVRNRNLFTTDDIIGVLKIPFIDLFSEKQQNPTWGHLYGPPMSGKDVDPSNYATKMQIYGDKIGSHYRGRLLYKITGKKDVLTKNIKNKLIFKFPYKVAPVIPLRVFLLRVDLIQGFGLPEVKQCYVQICIGEYTLKSKKYTMKSGLCQFYEIMQEKKLNIPQNPQSMPDLILYFCDGLNQNNRIAYIRIKAMDLINEDASFDQPKVYQLRTDKSLNHKAIKGTSGFITAKIHLLNSLISSPPRKTNVQKLKLKDQFILKVFLYRGQSFPPANQQGDCDPKISFTFDDQHFESQTKMSTYNPVWNTVMTKTISMQDLFTLNMQKCLICDVYDYEKDKKDNYIGSFSVNINGKMKKKLKIPKANEQIDFIYSKPRWYHIVNPNVQVGNQVFGRVLILCTIFKKDYKINGKKVNFQNIETQDIFKKIQTQTFKKNINFYFIGIRNLKLPTDGFFNNFQTIRQRRLKDLKIVPIVNLNCFQNKSNQSQNNQNQFQYKNGGCQINKIYRYKDVQIPKNKHLSTFIDFKITNQDKQIIYGYNSKNLSDFKDIYENESEQKKQKNNNLDILNVQELQGDLKKLHLLKNIIKQNQYQKQTAKYINKKRLQITNAQNLIPPSQIQTKANQKYQDDPQICIQMDKMLKQFQTQLARADQKNMYNYAYIRHNIGSSNNSNQNLRRNDTYNSIDQQLGKLGLSKKQEQIPKNTNNFNNNTILEQNHNEQDSLIQSKQKIFNNKQKYFKKNDQLLSSEQDEPIYGYDAKKNRTTKQRAMTYQDNQTGIQLKKDLTLRYSQNFMNTTNRFKAQQQVKKTQYKNSDIISNFDLNESLQLSEQSYSHKIIAYHNVQKGLKQQQKHLKQAIHDTQQYKYGGAVKLSLFKWNKQTEHHQKQTYQDYDTDEDQNLDIIPEWYKGRKILGNDLQNYLAQNRTIEHVHLYRGRKIQGLQTRVKQRVGTIKMVVLSGSDQSELQSTSKYYQKLLRQKQFSCRVYVLKGKSLITGNLQKPDTYLRFTYGQKVTQYKDKIVKKENNPEYYMCHQQWIKLPGPSTIKIQVMQTAYLIGSLADNLAKDRVIGYTEIDVQDRYFMKKWHLLEKKPIQLRNLYSQYGIGTQGRLQTWVDLVDKKQWLVNPPIKINPPPWDEYQLRVIVWSTKDCVFKNQELESNDVFVRGQIGGGNYQETDIHWACRSVGNFNYRFKFPVFYPPKPQDMYSDVFIVQIWDKDVIGYSNLIGQTRINLNLMHKLIQKAVKRKQPVSATKKIIQKNMAITDKFWFDVFNHKEKDQFGQLQSQGKVQLSFQLVPIQMAKKQRLNGFGRSEPNVYPTLPEPTGRLSFNFLRPLDFLKQLLGPNLYKSLCIKFLLILILAIIITLSILFSTSIVAGLVAKA